MAGVGETKTVVLRSAGCGSNRVATRCCISERSVLCCWLALTVVFQEDEAPVLFAWATRVGAHLMRTHIALAGELTLYAPDEMPYVYW